MNVLFALFPNFLVKLGKIKKTKKVSDTKDLQVPFSTAASLGYGLHHMLHLPHHFLHPVDPRLPFSAFRPLGPSAFAPPSKCLKVETGGTSVSSGLASIGSLSGMSNMFSPSLPSSGGIGGTGLSGSNNQEIAPQSPAGSASRSPTVNNNPGSVQSAGNNRGPTPEEEDRETNATPGSENTERSTPEEGRPYRREYKFFPLLHFVSLKISIAHQSRQFLFSFFIKKQSVTEFD